MSDAPSASAPALEPYLRAVVAAGASDLHVKAGRAPRVRIGNDLCTLDTPPLSAEQVEAMLVNSMSPRAKAAFAATNETDYALAQPGIGRFRFNVFRAQGAAGAVARLIPQTPPSIADLHLPEIVEDLALEQTGLVLVTGPTNSGKTTTLNAMVDAINSARPAHILTIEDPVEIVHEDKLAQVNQREVGTDTDSFDAALKAAMRQDPNVILVGEMRDPETVRTALRAAETGHLVLSTLHTTDAPETINRIIDFFPGEEQTQVRISLAKALRGIVSQRLVPTIDGRGRCAAVEILTRTARVTEAILEPEGTEQISDLVAEGSYYGMRTFDQHLVQLVLAGAINVTEAKLAASKPHDLAVALKRAGVAAAIVDAA